MTSQMPRMWAIFGAIVAGTLCVVLGGLLHDTLLAVAESHGDVISIDLYERLAAEPVKRSVVASSRCEMDERLQLLRRHCGNASSPHQGKYHGKYWRLLVDDKSKVLYCVLPKVASTTLKTVMASATRARIGKKFSGVVHASSFAGLKYLVKKHYNDSEIEQRLERYTKVIAVRNPFERLYSAFKNKFVDRDRHYATSGYYSTFVKAYLGDEYVLPNYDSDFKVMTFAQFLGLVVDMYSGEEAFGFTDRHWMSYRDLCLPCEIKYDLILKLETMETDFRLFSQLVYAGMAHGNHSNIHLGSTASYNEHGVLREEEGEREWEETIHNMTVKKFERLWQIYGSDFRQFGYTWRSHDNTKCVNTMAKVKNCC